MGRNIRPVLEDLSRLYDELQVREDASVIELAERLGVPRKRIYDYFEYLQAFFGEDCLEGHDGRYAWSLEAPTAMRVSAEERQVLAVADHLLTQIGMPFGEAFTRLAARLSGGDRARAQAERARAMDNVRRHLVFTEPNLCRSPGEAGLLDRLFTACTRPERRMLRFGYTSATSPNAAERRVWPLGLVFSQAWYLVGHDPSKAPAWRVYAVDRMREVREDTFGAAYAGEPIDMQAYMAAAWRLIVEDGVRRPVVLHMPAHLAHTTKHPTQRIVGVDGDGYMVSFEVASPVEMAGFVMRHVHEVTVVEPPALREAVRERLLAGLGRHAELIPATPGALPGGSAG